MDIQTQMAALIYMNVGTFLGNFQVFIVYNV